MTDAREYLAWGWWSPARQDAMRDALLAVLDECDRWDNEWAITNWPIAGHFTPPTAPIRAAIDKALGVTDE